jgi:ribosome-binding factor A
MDDHRSDRLARQLRAELGSLVETELDDPRVSNVVVTDVRLSRDLGHARVYVYVPEGGAHDRDPDHRRLLAGLESARGFLRRQLSLRLGHLRRTPELTFTYDVSIEQGTRVEALLERLSRVESEEPGDL